MQKLVGFKYNYLHAPPNSKVCDDNRKTILFFDSHTSLAKLISCIETNQNLVFFLQTLVQFPQASFAEFLENTQVHVSTPKISERDNIVCQIESLIVTFKTPVTVKIADINFKIICFDYFASVSKFDIIKLHASAVSENLQYNNNYIEIRNDFIALYIRQELQQCCLSSFSWFKNLIFANHRTAKYLSSTTFPSVSLSFHGKLSRSIDLSSQLSNTVIHIEARLKFFLSKPCDILVRSTRNFTSLGNSMYESSTTIVPFVPHPLHPLIFTKYRRNDEFFVQSLANVFSQFKICNLLNNEFISQLLLAADEEHVLAYDCVTKSDSEDFIENPSILKISFKNIELYMDLPLYNGNMPRVWIKYRNNSIVSHCIDFESNMRLQEKLKEQCGHHCKTIQKFTDIIIVTSE